MYYFWIIWCVVCCCWFYFFLSISLLLLPWWSTIILFFGSFICHLQMCVLYFIAGASLVASLILGRSIFLFRILRRVPAIVACVWAVEQQRANITTISVTRFAFLVGWDVPNRYAKKQHTIIHINHYTIDLLSLNSICCRNFNGWNWFHCSFRHQNSVEICATTIFLLSPPYLLKHIFWFRRHKDSSPQFVPLCMALAFKRNATRSSWCRSHIGTFE